MNCFLDGLGGFACNLGDLPHQVGAEWKHHVRQPRDVDQEGVSVFFDEAAITHFVICNRRYPAPANFAYILVIHQPRRDPSQPGRGKRLPPAASTSATTRSTASGKRASSNGESSGDQPSNPWHRPHRTPKSKFAERCSEFRLLRRAPVVVCQLGRRSRSAKVRSGFARGQIKFCFSRDNRGRRPAPMHPRRRSPARRRAARW
jgi:hypothetical protein